MSRNSRYWTVHISLTAVHISEAGLTFRFTLKGREMQSLGTLSLTKGQRRMMIGRIQQSGAETYSRYTISTMVASQYDSIRRIGISEIGILGHCTTGARLYQISNLRLCILDILHCFANEIFCFLGPPLSSTHALLLVPVIVH